MHTKPGTKRWAEIDKEDRELLIAAAVIAVEDLYPDRFHSALARVRAQFGVKDDRAREILAAVTGASS